jgi:hypothetical protein
MSTLRWQDGQLIYETPKQSRTIALYTGEDYCHLQTFWNGSTYLIGSGRSTMLNDPQGVESEAYWSTVQGATFLIHYRPGDGHTAVRTPSGKVLICVRPS